MKKTFSILKFIFHTLIWTSLRIPAIIFWPWLIYPLAPFIAKNKKTWIGYILWLFLNTEENYDPTEIFTLSNVYVAPDWYLEKAGFDESHRPGKMERWWYSYLWNVWRNPADNFLNNVIGFNGNQCYFYDNPTHPYNFWKGHEVENPSSWFIQSKDNGKTDLRFRWMWQNSWVKIRFGTNEFRYASYIKFFGKN